jgi:integrase
MSSSKTRPPAANTLSLQALLDRVHAANDLPGNAHRQWVTALRGIGRGLDRPLPQLPADPSRLGRMLAGTQGCHQRAGVSASTWRTYRSQFRAATRHFGLAATPARVTLPRSAAWIDLLDGCNRGERNFLSRLSGVMTKRGVEPVHMTEADFQAYRASLNEAAVRDPDRAYKGAYWAWRRVCDRNPALPDLSDAAPAVRSSYWLSWSEFPPPLEITVDEYYAGRCRSREVSFETLFEAAASGGSLKPSTAQGYKNYLLALASAAVAAGVPICGIVSLEALLSPDVYRPALKWLHARQASGRAGAAGGGGRTQSASQRYLHGIAHHVRSVLRSHFGRTVEQLKDIKAAVDNLAADVRMSPRTRQRLETLKLPAVLQALFRLPDRMFAELKSVETPTAEHAWTAAAVLLLAIGLDTALRRANLVRLEHGRHLGSVDAKTGRQMVEIPGEETKNAQSQVAELRPRTVALLGEYLTRWRPRIAPDDSPFLFPLRGLGEPGRDQTALRLLAGRLARLIQRELGVPFNLHMVRSLLATVYAEANPGDEITAQIKLGHKSPQTTHRFYIAPQQYQAHRRLDAMIDRRLAEPKRIIRRPAPPLEDLGDVL